MLLFPANSPKDFQQKSLFFFFLFLFFVYVCLVLETPAIQKKRKRKKSVELQHFYDWLHCPRQKRDTRETKIETETEGQKDTQRVARTAAEAKDWKWWARLCEHLACEDHNPDFWIIPRVIESSLQFHHRQRPESISSLRPVDSYLFSLSLFDDDIRAMNSTQTDCESQFTQKKKPKSLADIHTHNSRQEFSTSAQTHTLLPWLWLRPALSRTRCPRTGARTAWQAASIQAALWIPSHAIAHTCWMICGVLKSRIRRRSMNRALHESVAGRRMAAVVLNKDVVVASGSCCCCWWA